MINEEALLIDIKFKLDMYGSGQGSAEDTLAKIRKIISSSSLTDDQQVVLKELKTDQDGWDPFFTIWHMMENQFDMNCMPTKEQFQVLAAFAEWGLKEGNQ